ncbi:MAG: hypothetical protein IRY83_02335 [Chloroflexi bacterium]|nr:hypothetical protein [Chloroflexota bacterium]
MNIRDLFSAERLGDAWNVLREIDPQQVIREAHQPIRFVICGSPGVGKRRLAALFLNGEPDGPEVLLDICDMADDLPTALPDADVYLYVTSAQEEPGVVQRGHMAQLVRRSGRVLCALSEPQDRNAVERSVIRTSAAAFLGLAPEHVLAAPLDDPEAIRRTVAPWLIRGVPHLALALGRRLPALREAAADFLVSDAARANAEFVIISSLPTVIPVIGPLAAAGTDLLVLTKNQIMLLLKLALLYGRPIENRAQVLAEIAPAIGAAFVWRSAARTAAAVVPNPLTIIPRAAVAYVGTAIIGKAGQYYYRAGRRPSADIIASYRDEAIQQLRDILPTVLQIGRRLGLP